MLLADIFFFNSIYIKGPIQLYAIMATFFNQDYFKMVIHLLKSEGRNFQKITTNSIKRMTKMDDLFRLAKIGH